MIDASSYEVVSFDCYGTLVDWESGIISGLRPVLTNHGVEATDEEILALHAETEHGLQFSSAPGSYVRYWEPIPDTAEALRRLKSCYRLAVISNVDDGLFALTACRLEVEFDWIVTAEQVGTYKPNRRNFEVALDRMSVPRERLLHAAESLFHDVVPAKGLGITTVWVHRRSDKEGFGATPPADAGPDLVVPGLETLASELDS